MFPSSPNIRLVLLRVSTIQDSLGSSTLILLGSKEVIGINFSISSKEYYESKKQDYKIDIALKIQSFLYDGSIYADIKGAIYKIERSYLNGQFLELYLVETNINRGDIVGYN